MRFLYPILTNFKWLSSKMSYIFIMNKGSRLLYLNKIKDLKRRSKDGNFSYQQQQHRILTLWIKIHWPAGQTRRSPPWSNRRRWLEVTTGTTCSSILSCSWWLSAACSGDRRRHATHRVEPLALRRYVPIFVQLLSPWGSLILIAVFYMHVDVDSVSF
jgi:hypothetical protein